MKKYKYTCNNKILKEFPYPELRLLYDQVKTQQGQLMGEEMHLLIYHARNNLTDDIKDVIYEKRVLAETTLSRPVMKAFKAMIRQRGLFNNAALPLETLSIPD